MEDVSLNRLQLRVEALEAETRRWKMSLLLCLIAAGSLFLMAQTINKPKVLEAQRIILRGWNGEVRMVLGDQWPTFKLEKDYLFDGTAEGLRDAYDWGLHLYDPDGQYTAGFVSNQIILKNRQ